YTWSPTTALSAPYAATSTASPTTTTTYTVTAKVTATGCTKTDAVLVTVNPKPTANAGLDKTITTQGGSVTIGTTGILGNTYSWTPSLGLNNPTLAIPTASPTSTTTYTLTVTATATGCTNTDQVIVNVTVANQGNGSKGTNPLTQTQFNVFPNPVENVLNITSDAVLNGKYEIVILNTAGQEVVRKSVEAKEERLNLQINTLDLTQGIYILNIESVEGNSVHKLIKE
ncbi:MAG: T9SS type A sorting domain-containing protein, partial [Bacteroidia bacterium]